MAPNGFKDRKKVVSMDNKYDAGAAERTYPTNRFGEYNRTEKQSTLQLGQAPSSGEMRIDLMSGATIESSFY